MHLHPQGGIFNLDDTLIKKNRENDEWSRLSVQFRPEEKRNMPRYRLDVLSHEHRAAPRSKIMRAFGAELVMTSKSESLMVTIQIAEEITKRPNAFLARQFSKPSSIKAQEKTGSEIVDEIGTVGSVVAGVGIGGTLIGISNMMKKLNQTVKQLQKVKIYLQSEQ